ncbi:MAG: DMT family transporter [Oscillospiraceae bacterium]|jgi:drug/metabolite transporter (DMT)-like permease
MSSTKATLWPQLLIVCATIIWGSSFLIMKQTVDGIPVFTLLAIRFTVAGVLLSLVFWKKWRLLNKETLLGGGLLGTLMFLGYVFQTYGLSGIGSWEGTTPGKNAFLTATYCVLVPFLNWLLTRKRPDRYNIAAAVLCLLGIGLVSLTEDFTVVGGDVITLVCGVAFSLHILAVDRYAKTCDILLLTVLQFLFMALWSWIGVFLAGETLSVLPSGADILRLGYLAVCASGLAMLFQNIGQANTPPSTGAVLLSLEAPFGVVFSVLFGTERPTAQMYLGFVLIFFAVILSETKLSFLSKKKAEIGG